MKKHKNIDDALELLVNKAVADFKRHGVAIPNPRQGGGVNLPGFQIIKDNDGFYSVLDANDNVMANKINLPHTAIVVANELSLGKMINSDLLLADRLYGYLQFELAVCTNSRTKSIKRGEYDRADYLEDKYSITMRKSAEVKSEIDKHFKKLQTRINNLITSGK